MGKPLMKNPDSDPLPILIPVVLTRFSCNVATVVIVPVFMS